jgi:peptidoglycan/xylan/chitin deacetylase (PgdA/CDA1 family)
MFYDEKENQKSISLVSIIAIILASLLVVGSVIYDVQSGLTYVDTLAKGSQEIVVAQDKQKKEQNNQENKPVENKPKEEQKIIQPQAQPIQEQPQQQVQQPAENAVQQPVQQPEQNQTPAVTPTQPEQPAAPVSDEQNYGKIFLTFDDGPSNATTGRLLDILKQYNVKATFFVTGNGSDELIKREYNEGHSIGLHTYSHSYKTVYASEEAFFDDLGKVDQRVYNAIGVHSKITRFPGGASNTVSKFNPGIMTRLAKQLKEKGYKYWDWNISSGDAGETKDPDKIFENVTSQLSNDKRNIVLMHDIHEFTINSIERIIVWAKENNYEFCRIEENMDPVHHRIAN